jgi:UDP-3-O-[3-hydroxymyristoyl] N-acetylglucosamine deacetylase
LAALWALDVTHCEIELNAPEVPILDGSSAPWIEAVRSVGLNSIEGERPVWTLGEPVWIEDGGASVLGLPHSELRISTAVDFGHPFAGPQSVDFTLGPGVFERELAAARTFTLDSWLPRLRGAGLIKGGSEENAVVLRDSGPSSPWRMPEEIARHKALDLVGDVALGFADSGAGFVAHLIAIKAGHGAHRHWLETCLKCGALVGPQR